MRSALGYLASRGGRETHGGLINGVRQTKGRSQLIMPGLLIPDHLIASKYHYGWLYGRQTLNPALHEQGIHECIEPLLSQLCISGNLRPLCDLGGHKPEATSKGLVFTTFYSFCQERLGEDGLDDVIDAARLPHAGAYTSVGTYSFDEMVSLITAYVRHTDRTMPDVMGEFGEYCFGCWVKKFPDLFDGRDLFDVLAEIDNFHESEVRRLYPDAELPSFRVISRENDCMLLDYISCKPLADLAAGVIRAAGKHLGSPADVGYVPTAEGTRLRVQRIGTVRLAA